MNPNIFGHFFKTKMLKVHFMCFLKCIQRTPSDIPLIIQTIIEYPFCINNINITLADIFGN